MDTSPLTHCRSLRRGLSVLKLFSREAPELSGGDIVRAIGLHKTTTYRMLGVLSECGFLSYDSRTALYSIGPVVHSLGELVFESDALLLAAVPVVKLLNDLTKEGCSLGVLEGTNVIYRYRAEAGHSLRWTLPVGSAMPAHTSALGKAILSGLSNTALDRLFPSEDLPALTPNTITSKTSLKLNLKIVRNSGVSRDAEEAVLMLQGFGSPIRDQLGSIIAGISLSVPAFRLKRPDYELYSQLIQLGGRLVSSNLGFTPKTDAAVTETSIHRWWLERRKAG